MYVAEGLDPDSLPFSSAFYKALIPFLWRMFVHNPQTFIVCRSVFECFGGNPCRLLHNYDGRSLLRLLCSNPKFRYNLYVASISPYNSPPWIAMFVNLWKDTESSGFWVGNKEGFGNLCIISQATTPCWMDF